MKYFAVYQDDRDELGDWSAIAECQSVDDCSDAIVRYFRYTPESYKHMVSWRIYGENDITYASGVDCILD